MKKPLVKTIEIPSKRQKRSQLSPQMSPTNRKISISPLYKNSITVVTPSDPSKESLNFINLVKSVKFQMIPQIQCHRPSIYSAVTQKQINMKKVLTDQTLKSYILIKNKSQSPRKQNLNIKLEPLQKIVDEKAQSPLSLRQKKLKRDDKSPVETILDEHQIWDDDNITIASFNQKLEGMDCYNKFINYYKLRYENFPNQSEFLPQEKLIRNLKKLRTKRKNKLNNLHHVQQYIKLVNFDFQDQQINQ